MTVLAHPPLRVLFVTWDGPGTAYHESLFLPLLERACRPDDKISLLQFTWEADERSERIRAHAGGLGMEYNARSWSEQPGTFGVLAAIWQGAREIAQAVARGNNDVVLARSIVPGAMTVVAKRLSRQPFHFIYDADGLAADERAEFGGWDAAGMSYRVFRALERAAIRNAHQVLVRTPQATGILKERTRVAEERFRIVTNGKDASVFQPGSSTWRAQTRADLGLSAEAPLIVYVGSVGPQYRVPEMMRLFEIVASMRDGAVLLFLTSNRFHAHVRQTFINCPGSLILKEVTPTDVPKYLAASDLGLALRTPTLSQQAVSPIKVGEYLLCGVPVAYTPGIGNLDAELSRTVAFPVATQDEFPTLASWFINDVLPRREYFRGRARRVGLASYSLSKGGSDYATVFDAARQPPLSQPS